MSENLAATIGATLGFLALCTVWWRIVDKDFEPSAPNYLEMPKPPPIFAWPVAAYRCPNCQCPSCLLAMEKAARD